MWSAKGLSERLCERGEINFPDVRSGHAERLRDGLNFARDGHDLEYTVLIGFGDCVSEIGLDPRTKLTGPNLTSTRLC